MQQRQYTRIDTIRRYVDRMLLENKDDTDRRNGYVHLYAVGMAAALIALKRGHDRAWAELAEIAGMLHDYTSYQGKDGPNHAQECEPVVRALLLDARQFQPEEIELICHAVCHHSEKGSVGTAFDEIVKDADVLHHWLRNPMEEYWYDNDRARQLAKEFALNA